MNPRISVVMASYNTKEDFLKEAVSSILSQSLPDFEFLIIDDFSDIKVSKVLGNVKDERIFVHRNERNVGLTKSLNIGINLTTTNFIARMDADDISAVGRLASQYKWLKNNKDYALLGSDVEVIDEQGRKIKDKIRQHDHNSVGFYSYKNNPFVHSSIMFKKDCFLKIGGYDNYYRYAQDYDLCGRFIDNFKCMNIPELLLKWRDSKNGISSRKVNEQTAFADEIVVKRLYKNFPEFMNIDKQIVLSIRRNKVVSKNCSIIGSIIKRLVDKYDSDYSRSYYKEFKNKFGNYREVL